MDTTEFDFLSETTPAEETKNETFLRLANKRLPAAVKRIRLLGNLSNAQNYDYTPEQVSTLIATLQKEVDKVADGFQGRIENDIPTLG